MAARHAAVARHADPDEDVAAEAFDERAALSGAGRWLDLRWPGGQGGQELIDERDALSDLADADPDARVDVARLHDRHVELELAVRRIARRAACIESAPRG